MRRVPEKIKKLMDVCDAYLKEGELSPNAPTEVKDAWKEVDDWFNDFDSYQC